MDMTDHMIEREKRLSTKRYSHSKTRGKKKMEKGPKTKPNCEGNTKSHDFRAKTKQNHASLKKTT